MKIIKKYFVPIIAVSILIVACVKINIVNTESLSPLGNSDDNFELVSAEFGEDFQEFIMDKSDVKIYIGEKDDGEATMKIRNKEINLTNNNFFMNSLEYVGNYINEAISFIMEKLNIKTNNNIDEINGNNINSDSVDESTVNDKNIDSDINNDINNSTKENDQDTDFDKTIDDFIKNINN